MEQHKYMALANSLRSAILEGKYSAGEKLPSENELTQELGVSRQTVRQAIQILEMEGITQRIRGSGTYVRKLDRRTKSYNIAVITTYISEYIFPVVLNGIVRTLADKRYSSIVASTHNRVDNERRVLNEFIEKKNVDGFIIEGTKTALPNPNINLYKQIKDMGLPLLFINGVYPELRDSSVYILSDDRQGGYDACSFLIKKGHSRIAGIFKADDSQGLGRYAGMAAAMLDSGLMVNDDNILWFTTTDQESVLNTSALKTIKDCSAVICYNDQVALRIIELLRAEGIRIPQDVAVISFDNSMLSDVASVKITSLDYPKEQFGRLAAEKMLNMLNGIKESPTIMPWGFSEKEST